MKSNRKRLAFAVGLVIVMVAVMGASIADEKIYTSPSFQIPASRVQAWLKALTNQAASEAEAEAETEAEAEPKGAAEATSEDESEPEGETASDRQEVLEGETMAIVSPAFSTVGITSRC